MTEKYQIDVKICVMFIPNERKVLQIAGLQIS